MSITKDQQMVADFYEKVGNVVKGHLIDIIDGPLVFNFIMNPGENSNLSTIRRAASEYNYMVSYENGHINVQVPNKMRQKILLKNLLKSKEFKTTDAILPVIMGVDTFGKTIVKDLRKLPHLLVTGRTGSGKTVFLHCILNSLKPAMLATECKFIIIDPVGVDYGMWDSDKHLMCPVVRYDVDAAIQKLQEVTELIDDRYQKLQTNKVKNVEEYRKKTNNKDMPYIVVLVDEFVDLMHIDKKRTETCIQCIAQKARAVGIHLIIGTQRPEALTGMIKANLPTKIAFQARTNVDSMQMLCERGAENLLPYGDMLFSDAGRDPVRIHAPYVEY